MICGVYMKITVLCGGISSERDVSLVSGSKIAAALRRCGHSVALIDLFLGVHTDSIDTLFTTDETGSGASIAAAAPDIDAVRAARTGGIGHLGENVIAACLMSDIVFLGLHGVDGEDGKIQGLFDLLDIKYTGSPSFGSALAMNKSVAKEIMRANGVTLPVGVTLKRGRAIDISTVGFPCVVKPCCGGSSVGVTIVNEPGGLLAALETAFQQEDTVLVEQYIKGREVSVGVMDGKAMPVIEIIPKTGFYDYEHKYQEGVTDEICPADLPVSITRELQKAAEKVYSSLDLAVYCRVDFIISGTGMPYCLEANTLPGMTPLSLLPQEAAAAGMDYDELCDRIVTLSLRRYGA